MREVIRKKESRKTKNRIYPEQIVTLYGKMIYPTLMVILVYGWYVGESFLFGGLAIVYGLRLFQTRQRKIIRVSLLMSVVLICYFYEIQQRDKKEILNTSVTKTVITFPDTLSINDQYLTTLVQEVGRPSHRLYLRCRVREMKQSEQIEWYTRAQLLIVQGSETAPPQIRNRGGFDTRLYFKDLGVSKILTAEKFLRVSQPQLSFWNASFREKRARLSWHAEQNFPSRTASYIKRLFLGIKDDIYKQERSSYSETGLLHFFSISGLHVYFFLNMLNYSCRRIGCSTHVLLVIELLFLVSFVLLTGESISVIRAAFFVSFNRLNLFIGGRFTRVDIWCMTLLIVMFIRPYSLLTAGGQLTFYFTFILLYLQEILPKTLTRWRREVKAAVWISLLSLPLLVYHFYQWSLFGSSLTLLLSPFFGYLLLPVLLISWLTSSLISMKGSLWVVIIEKMLASLYRIISYVSQWSLLKINTGKVPLVIVVVMVIFYFSYLGYAKKKTSYYWKVFVMSICLFSSLKYLNPFGTVAFLDVGQGDCMVMIPPFSTKATIVDTGGKLSFQPKKRQATAQVKYNLIPFLRSYGVKEIETLFMTHADTDHIGDVEVLSRTLPIREVVFPKGMTEKALGAKVITSLDKRTKATAVLSPQKIVNGVGTFQVLAPSEMGVGDNTHSLVLAAIVGGVRLLLTGDLDIEGEEAVMKQWQPTTVDILKLGHHGSRFSTSEQWLSHISPKAAIVSCGKNNRYGHPHKEVMMKLDEKDIIIFRTDEQGMVYYDYMTLFPYHTKIKTMIE